MSISEFISEMGVDKKAADSLRSQSEDLIKVVISEGILDGKNPSSLLMHRIRKAKETVKDSDTRETKDGKETKDPSEKAKTETKQAHDEEPNKSTVVRDDPQKAEDKKVLVNDAQKPVNGKDTTDRKDPVVVPPVATDRAQDSSKPVPVTSSAEATSTATTPAAPAAPSRVPKVIPPRSEQDKKATVPVPVPVAAPQADLNQQVLLSQQLAQMAQAQAQVGFQAMPACMQGFGAFPGFGVAQGMAPAMMPTMPGVPPPPPMLGLQPMGAAQQAGMFPPMTLGMPSMPTAPAPLGGQMPGMAMPVPGQFVGQAPFPGGAAQMAPLPCDGAVALTELKAKAPPAVPPPAGPSMGDRLLKAANDMLSVGGPQ